MQLKKINNTLKKSCVVMTKIHNGSIMNAALAKIVTCDAIFYIDFDQNGPPCAARLI